ncbi:V-set and transmembrane domain-containing protein 4a isoform X1 [Gadus morhua]|uniref:V-set and transmembrane domain-containing protein 4a isoform X1 n=1 Tax=Gadus morhua TaxID=8049 RepID=UPI0011B818DE|nr:V-set and transmembrane domain-containing protein 4-like isoform X1 [Gadus morhua]
MCVCVCACMCMHTQTQTLRHECLHACAFAPAEVCDALNVTVVPGPVAMVTERDNLTLSCRVSQRKRASGVLVLRWFFSPAGAVPPPSSSSPSPPPPPPPSPQPSPSSPSSSSEVLIVRMGIKKMKQYGNYSRRFPQPKFLLQEEPAGGEVFRLLVLNVTAGDQGVYSCRVQEIRRHRNIWRASSNGTGSTTLAVRPPQEEGSGDGMLRLVSDLYLCAVLICCLGLLSIFLFTLVLGCQHLLRRRHRLKASYLLVKCPESSSGETVTDSTCSSSSSPRAQRKESLRPPRSRARPKAAAGQMPPKAEDPPPPPPHRLPKVPEAQQKPRKPRRLKNQTRRSTPQRDYYQEDSLTYAELELVRPRPEPPVAPPTGPAETPTPTPAPCSTTSTIITTMDTNADTVYAQILFQEKQL